MQYNPDLFMRMGQEGLESPEVLGAFAAGASPYAKEATGSPRRAPGEAYVGPDGASLPGSPRRGPFSVGSEYGPGGDGGGGAGGGGFRSRGIDFGSAGAAGGGWGGTAAGGSWGGAGGGGWGAAGGPVQPYTERVVALGADGQSPQRLRGVFEPAPGESRAQAPADWGSAARSAQQPAGYQGFPPPPHQSPASSGWQQQTAPSGWQQQAAYQSCAAPQPTAGYPPPQQPAGYPPPQQPAGYPPPQPPVGYPPPQQYPADGSAAASSGGWGYAEHSRGYPPQQAASPGWAASPRSAAAAAPLPPPSGGAAPVDDPAAFAEEVTRRYIRGGRYDTAPAYLPPMDASVAAQGRSRALEGNDYGNSRSLHGAGGAGAAGGAAGAGGGGPDYGRMYGTAVPVCSSVYRIGDHGDAGYDGPGHTPHWAGPGAAGAQYQ
eukprot:TRINITY_DN9840_c0_g1_i1.p2 TRINITY_DN9840_c0_g1~~TRINITY_DN9840_c0_g1_i1.p2  ORF type:complete len:432 (+),score=87.10 TRINITY_DN9840_c0_g1_i1:95-1390(+)